MNTTTILAVFVGGGFGSILRFVVSLLSLNFTNKIWAGTLIVNVVGSIIYLSLFKLLEGNTKLMQAFIKIGLLGGLTTFSSFSFEVVSLIKSGDYIQSGLVFILNILFGIIVGVWVLR
ncbi:MAG: CrcB family protein [Bdellovibrionales bacterium]|jgi:fluoride exporter|nr:CrcB family protein [Bdellovibrionales bacterium]